MIELGLLAVVAGVAAVILWWPRARPAKVAAKAGRQAPASAAKPSNYHAVEIRCADHCCAAARALQGRPFLSAEAPLLPLPECDAAECRCRYRHMEDRRQGDRRDGLDQTWKSVAGSERRHRPDRRQESGK